MKTYMSNILRLLLDYVNYLDLSDEYLMDLKYLIKKEYYPLSETSSKYLDIVKQNNKEKFVSFTEEGMRFSHKNKISQKRVTILT